MKSYEEFKEFYSQELLDDLLIIEGIRKQILVKSASITVLLLFAATCVPLLIPGIETLYVGILCAVVWYPAIRFITKDYRYHFKEMIIHPLIRFIDPDLSYAPEGFINLYTFRRAEIFQRYVNEFDGEDLVSGMIGNTKIEFSEVRARYKDEDAYLDSAASMGGHPFIIAAKYLFAKCFCDHDVFKGLFFVADFHKTFYGQVLVMPDKAEKYFGRFGEMLQSHNFIRGELMKMDNAEFEQAFVVYGSDQIQARYVLTPAIMNKILDFKKQTGNSICLSFKDSMLYIAVSCKRNLFEPRYFKNLVDYIATFHYFQDLRLFIGIVEEFNLNTRIWTRE